MADTRKYQVLALAHVTVSLGVVEAENASQAWTLGNELLKRKRGERVSSQDFLDTPTVEEIAEVVLDDDQEEH